MPTLTDQPCLPWDVDRRLCQRFENDPGLADAAILWASTFLWRRSGRKIGVCPFALSIVTESCGCAPCVCGPRSLIKLSDSKPVVAVTKVTDVAAAVDIDPGLYDVFDSRYLGLSGGASCNWTTAYCGEVAIEGTVGYVPDAEALSACADLACQWMLEKTDAQCTPVLSKAALASMPRGRNGRRNVTLTGVKSVDMWLLSLPPGGAGMMDADEAQAYRVG